MTCQRRDWRRHVLDCNKEKEGEKEGERKGDKEGEEGEEEAET